MKFSRNKSCIDISWTISIALDNSLKILVNFCPAHNNCQSCSKDFLPKDFIFLFSVQYSNFRTTQFIIFNYSRYLKTRLLQLRFVAIKLCFHSRNYNFSSTSLSNYYIWQLFNSIVFTKTKFDNK